MKAQARSTGRSADTLLARCHVLLSGGKASEALQWINQSFPDGADDPRLTAQKGYAEAALGQVAQALADAEHAMQSQSLGPASLDLVGHTFTMCQQPDRARIAFTRGLQLAPNHMGMLFNVAATAGFLGRSDEAEDAYDRIIASQPENADAWLNRSLLRRQTHTSNHVQQLNEALSAPNLPTQSAISLRYALGKELEDLGDHKEAFDNLAIGAKLRRQHMRYDVSDDISVMKRIARTHDKQWCASIPQPSDLKQGSIFIIGMPRAGSTLLETMLGRHNQVQALGELPHFGQAVINCFRETQRRMPHNKAELIDTSKDLPASELGQNYRNLIAPLRNERLFATDKLPINFLYAGLIAKALPDSTLLHIRRDPLDACFAMFKTLFRDAYPFSYNQTELGQYYRAYCELMDHWRHTLGARLVEVDYEALTNDPKSTLANLMPKLGLRVHEDCLHPENTHQPVMTASASQVRQTIHNRSVGSGARHYRALRPLKIALGINAIDGRDE